MKITPAQLWPWVRGLLYGAVIAVIWFGLRDLHLLRVAAHDQGTPTIRPGTWTVVRTVAEDGGEILRGSLYFLRTADRSPHLVRVVAAPGETVRRHGGRVYVGDRVLGVPAEEVLHWPEHVPADHFLVLTDQPIPNLADSRTLGPVTQKLLAARCVVPLRLFPGMIP